MQDIRRKQLTGYGVALLATLGCLLVRRPLFPLLGYHSELMTFFPAIILSAYLGGLGPGLTATLLGGVAGHYFIVEPRYSFAFRDPGVASAFVLYVLAGVVISGLTESLHRAHRRILANERRRADESEQRWRNLTEALPQLVWSAAPDGACDYFSTQWTEHTGVAEADLLGWRWLLTLHPEDREPTRQFWLESVAGRRPYDVEYRVRRRDGEYRWFKTRGVPIRDGVGNIVKWFGTCTDITDLRQTEESLRASEARFRGTFENAAVGIAHVDTTGRFLRVNQKYSSIIGYSHDELMQATIRDITHPEDWAGNKPRCWSMIQGDLPGSSIEQRYVRKGGSIVWVELSAALQRDAVGNPAYSISVIQDISARKELEGELRRAKDAAEAANRAKDEFLSNVSHEIRTPMNAILGMTELALGTPMTDDQRQCLKTAKSAADNLLGIINDLLDFAKIEAGKMELDLADFSLRAAVDDTLRTLAERAHMKGLKLVCNVQPDVPDPLIGDAGRLRQILLNLVGNAIKFTERGEVVVSVGMTNDGMTNDERSPNDEARTSNGSETDPGCSLDIGHSSFVRHSSFDIRHSRKSFVDLHFEVRDTGIGIPQDKQQRIFRAFEQEDSTTTRRFGGTGLGLTIASQLAALMGGKITLDSAPGRGSTFGFTARFEIQPPRPESRGAFETSPKRSEPSTLTTLHSPLTTHLRILVAEDNEFNAQLLEQLLGRRGHRVQTANNGREALAMLGIGSQRPEVRSQKSEVSDEHSSSSLTSDLRPPTSEFDLLLLDVHMPGLDGFQVIRTIRERERGVGGHLPVIALTARSRKEDRDRCLAAGMDDFLAKPVQASDLEAAIDRVVVSGKESEIRNPKSESEARAISDFGFGISDLTTHHSLLTTHLLDPRVLLAACGGDAAILEKICQALRTSLPDQMTAIRNARREQNMPVLREAAHKLSGMIAAFSTIAGDVAADLEDCAAEGRSQATQPLVQQLETMAQEVVRLVGNLSLDDLLRQAQATADDQSAGGTSGPETCSG